MPCPPATPPLPHRLPGLPFLAGALALLAGCVTDVPLGEPGVREQMVLDQAAQIQVAAATRAQVHATLGAPLLAGPVRSRLSTPASRPPPSSAGLAAWCCARTCIAAPTGQAAPRPRNAHVARDLQAARWRGGRRDRLRPRDPAPALRGQRVVVTW